MDEVGTNGSAHAQTLLASAVALAGQTATPPSDDSYAEAKFKFSGPTLGKIGKWVGALVVGGGLSATAATTISQMSTMAEQVKTLQTDVSALKDTSARTAEDVAFMRGMFFPPEPPPRPKKRR